MNSHNLSPRQLEVVVGLANSMTRKEIALRAGLSLKTIEYHIKVAADRIGVSPSDVAAFTRWSARRKLVEI